MLVSLLLICIFILLTIRNNSEVLKNGPAAPRFFAHSEESQWLPKVVYGVVLISVCLFALSVLQLLIYKMML